MASLKPPLKVFAASSATLPRIARADKSAVQECVDLYGNMIWALAKQSTDSAAEAEKAVAEIFTDIWRNAPFCDVKTAEEVVWIALIARRRLSELVLKKNCRQQSEYKMNISTVSTEKISENLRTA